MAKAATTNLARRVGVRQLGIDADAIAAACVANRSRDLQVSARRLASDVRSLPRLPVRGQRRQQSLDTPRIERQLFQVKMGEDGVDVGLRKERDADELQLPRKRPVVSDSSWPVGRDKAELKLAALNQSSKAGQAGKF